jgi:hypothetical protein
VLLDFIRIRTDGLKIEEDLPLGQHWPVLRVEDVKIVYVSINRSIARGEAQYRSRGRRVRTELAATDDNDVSRLFVHLHPAASIRRDPRRTEEAGILVHIQWDTPYMVGLEQTFAQIMDEAE